MFKELGYKINDYILENYPLFYNGRFSKDLYVCGGVIRDLMLDKEPKDIDFFMIDNKKEINSFIKRNQLYHTKNSFGNSKVLYDGVDVDFMSVNASSDLVVYNADGLFFNMATGRFVLQGFENLPSDQKLVLLNDESMHPSSARVLERRVKLQNFVKELDERNMFEEIAQAIEEEKDMFEDAPESVEVSEFEDNEFEKDSNTFMSFDIDDVDYCYGD